VPVSREQLFAVFFFAVFLFLLYQLYLFVSPFLVPLVWAAILALTFSPLSARLLHVLGDRRSLVAATLVLTIVVVVVLPGFYLGAVLVEQAGAAYTRVQQAVADGEFVRLLEWFQTTRLGGLWLRVAPLFDELSINLSDLLLRATNWVSNQIVGQAASLARNILLTVFNSILMLVGLFFFLRDGEAMARRVHDLLPMEPAHKEAAFSRVATTLTAVVQGMVVTAAAQGLLAGVGYWLIGGLAFSVFLGFLTGLASFIPLAGPALVWGGSSIYLLASGHVGRGIALALWGALIVSTADNFIKPLFIGGRARLPTFLLLVSIMGGLSTYGFLGIFLGPVVLALLLVFVDIYREEYPVETIPLVVTPADHTDRAVS
jgi:predicted PurR-regulated permease PerM